MRGQFSKEHSLYTGKLISCRFISSFSMPQEKWKIYQRSLFLTVIHFFSTHILSLSLDVKSLFRILFHYYFIDSTRSFKCFHLLFHSIQQFRISRPDYGWFPNIIHSLQWCDARLATINEMKRQKRMRFPTPPRLTIPITIQNVPSKYETKMEVPIFVESIKHIIEITVSWN